jgi:cell division protein FtsI/penicillin-binding protein 2
MRVDAKHISRQKAISLLGVALALVLTARLVSLQFWSGEIYSARAKSQHVKSSVLQAGRGRILDRQGRVLATNLEAESFFINRILDSKDLRAIAVRFSPRSDEDKLLKRLREKHSFVWLARKVFDGPSDEKVPKGVGRMVEMRRSYPMGVLAGQVLGYTDIDNLGIEGVERAFNSHLVGSPGEMEYRVDARGKVLGALGTIMTLPEDGKDLVLTLDADFQSILEEELSAAVSEFEAESGMAILTSPQSGEILAMANIPLYDPNAFGKFAAGMRRNRTVTDHFEPGSTFKLVAISGAIEESIYSPDDRIFCENGSIEVAGGTIRDTHPNGWLTVNEIMSQSSNIGVVKIAREIGQAGLFKYVRLFGFGSETAGGFPGESPGDVRHPSKWSRRSLETISIGQEIGVTALQMVAAYGAVANGGELLAPRITMPGNGASGPREVVRRVVSEETATYVSHILESVVSDGTGSNASVPGYRVAGKTGTAQKAKPGGAGYDPQKYVSSFIGFLPVGYPEFLCLVVVDSPKGIHWGSQVAAPVFSRVMNRILSLRKTPMRHRVAQREDDTRYSSAPDPILTGLNRRTAKRVLDRHGYDAKVVGTGKRVVAQTVDRNSTRLRVSDATLKSKWVQTPNVLGFPLRQAIYQLTAAGLNVKTSGSGEVIGQTPAPGTAVGPGTVCKVTCASEKG